MLKHTAGDGVLGRRCPAPPARSKAPSADPAPHSQCLLLRSSAAAQACASPGEQRGAASAAVCWGTMKKARGPQHPLARAFTAAGRRPAPAPRPPRGAAAATERRGRASARRCAALRGLAQPLPPTSLTNADAPAASPQRALHHHGAAPAPLPACRPCPGGHGHEPGRGGGGGGPV